MRRLGVRIPPAAATPLFVAAQKGNAHILAALLAHGGSDPNQPRDDWTTPLYIAAQLGHEQVTGIG